MVFVTPELVDSASEGTAEIKKENLDRGKVERMPGYIVSVIGGKGGVGKSQVAANLAFAYAGATKQKTLLLDFDKKAAGDQNVITGTQGQKNLKDLSEFSEAIDPKSFQQFVTPHPSNVHYIGMPNDSMSQRELICGSLRKTLKAVTSMYQLTVIDGGSSLDDLCLKGLEFTTMIFMVVTLTFLLLIKREDYFLSLQQCYSLKR